MVAPFVLAVEDSDSDFALIEMALQQCLGSFDFVRASDGEQALALLQTAGTTAHERLPDLVLLDIKLPRVNGLDVLNFIKSQDFIRDVPIVVFTSSSDAREKRQALALGAKEFITKPISLNSMMDTLNQVCSKYLQNYTQRNRSSIKSSNVG
jgi:CheY-like chemotaxis protein